MKRVRRFLALAGVILLLSLYVATFISACLATPGTNALFRACIAATVFVPIVLYAYTLFYRVVSGRGEAQGSDAQPLEYEEEEHKGGSRHECKNETEDTDLV